MEIEAKFTIPDAETLHRIEQAEELAGYALSPAETRNALDTYLDTPGRLIRAAGYFCRRRVIDSDILITIKSFQPAAGAVHRREEFEIALDGDLPPSDWPASSARDCVLEIIDGAELVPLFDLKQTRTVRTILEGQRSIAEMSLDQVHVDADERKLLFFELEIELMPDGTEEALGAMVSSLRDDWNLQPEPTSKFERALDFVNALPTPPLLTPTARAVCERIAAMDNAFSRRAQAILALDAGASPADAGARAGFSPRRAKYWRAAFEEKGLLIFPEYLRNAEVAETPHLQPMALTKPGIEIGDSMSEAGRKTLLFHFSKMLQHEEGTRAGQNIEELHDMRVATRRMRAALRVFDAYLDADALRPFVKTLRRTARTLGAVRDLDVFKEKTQRYLDGLPAGQKNDLDVLMTAWQTEYDARRADLIAHLDGEDYSRFREVFGGLAKTPGAMGTPNVTNQGEPLPYRVRQVVPVRLYEHYSQVVAYDEWITAGDVPLSRYHQLRIASKGLRYTLEFFQEILGPDAESLVERIKYLQDHLGSLQDAVVGCTILRNFLAWGKWRAGERKGSRPGEIVVAPAVATYLAVRQEEIQRLVAAFPQIWQEIASSEFKRRLVELGAAL